MRRSIVRIVAAGVLMAGVASAISVVAYEQEMEPEEVMQWLQQHLPAAAEELRDMKEEAPGHFDDHVEEWDEDIQDYLEVKNKYPQTAERMLEAKRLDYQSWEVARQIGETQDKAERERLLETLRQNLSSVFDARLEERNLELQELTTEIAELKALIDKRQRMKDIVIKRRISVLLVESEDAEELEWW